jgi:Kef-type K+ transport system membrane component KefB
MPITALIFLIACLACAMLVRRLFSPVFKIPTVFLYLLLGTLLASLTKSSPELLTKFHATSVLHSIDLIGWLGCLVLIALGPCDDQTHPQRETPWIQTAKISLIGFGGTFACASLLGYAIAKWQPQLLGSAGDTASFAMAIGLACAVTALPVLIALLHERGEAAQPLGKMAIRVAILDDIWMWLAVIVVTGMVQPHANPWGHVAKVLGLVVLCRTLLRPLLATISLRAPHMTQANCMVLGLGTVVTMAILSESLGTHALLGAFLAGWNLPHTMVKTLRTSLLPTAQTLMVPFFFITTGMKTDFSFDTTDFLLLALFFTTIGVGLKMGFVTLAARYAGLRWGTAAQLGALLQCKGLMDIVVLGMMFEAKIISAQAFSALITMVFACTVLTVPLYGLVSQIKHRGLTFAHGRAAGLGERPL